MSHMLSALFCTNDNIDNWTKYNELVSLDGIMNTPLYCIDPLFIQEYLERGCAAFNPHYFLMKAYCMRLGLDVRTRFSDIEVILLTSSAQPSLDDLENIC